MDVIKNIGGKVAFIKVEDNCLYLKDILFVFIVYLPCYGLVYTERAWGTENVR